MALALQLRTIAQELAGDLLALAAAAVVIARHDAAAGDEAAQAWLGGEACQFPPPAGTLAELELPPWAGPILEGLGAGLTLSRAAAAAGVSRNTVYTLARRSPRFATAMADAKLRSRASGRRGRRPRRRSL